MGYVRWLPAVAALTEAPGARAPSLMPTLGELGWRGRFQSDDPGVVQLREQLSRHAGIAGLQTEVVDSNREGFAERAARLFERDGWVLLADALEPERLETIRGAATDVARQMVELDPRRLGDRGSHRYCYGTAWHTFGHSQSWALTVDPPKVLAVVRAIFGSDDFRCCMIGGDFILPGGVDYQDLHVRLLAATSLRLPPCWCRCCRCCC